MMTFIQSTPESIIEFGTDPRTLKTPVAVEYFPRCDGGAWPEIEPSDAIDRQKLEFLAAYTHLNRIHDCLREAQERGAVSQAAAIASKLEAMITLRDRLEDCYAPVGFYAEPVMRGHLAVNLIFHYAQKFVRENHTRYDALDVTVKIPLPEKALRAEFSGQEGISIGEIYADLKLRSRAELCSSDVP